MTAFPRARPRPGRAAAAGAGVALLCATAGLATPALAADLSLQADATAAQDTVYGSRTRYFRQAYWGQFRHVVAGPLSYQLSLRYQEDRGDFTTLGTTSDVRQGTLTPTAELAYRREDLGLNLRYELNHTAQRAGQGALQPAPVEVKNDVARYAGNAFLRFSRDLESSLYADRTTYSSLGSDIGPASDNSTDRAGLAFRYERGRFRMTEETRASRYTDGASGATRLSYGPRFTLDYARPIGDRYNLTARYALDYERTEQEVLGGATVAVPVEFPPVAGLHALSPVPLDGALDPMPAVIDGAIGTATPISLGPDGQSFHNLGVDMGRVLQLDIVRVIVRSGAGVTIPSSAPITWSVYTSEDGSHWGLIEGARSSFDIAMSAYVVEFPESTARYFKVVNFGVNTIETFVTELQVFDTQITAPHQTQVSSRAVHSFGLSGSARFGLLRLSYFGNANVIGLTGSGAPTEWSNDLMNTASVIAGPLDRFTLRVSGTLISASQRAGTGYSMQQGSAKLSYNPIERFEAAVEAFRITTRVFPVTSLTMGSTLSTTAQILDALTFNAIAGLSRHDLDTGGVTDVRSGTSTLTARIYRWLTVTGSAALQRTYSRGDVSAQQSSPLLRVVPYERYSVEVLVQPSSQLVLYALGGYTSSANGAGPMQSFRADWTPLQRAAFQVHFDYTEDVDPFTGARIRRFTANPSWAINRFCSLQFYYAVQRGRSGPEPVDATNMFLTFRVFKP